MDIMVREITVSDYSEVVLLWTEVLGNKKVNYENFLITIEKMNKMGNYKTFVALSENRVIGFITVMQALAMGFPIGYFHVQGFAVHNEFQHKGIGTKLLNHVENNAKETGISFIILNSGFKRTDAHAFYEHNGYDKDSYCFDKIISPNE